MEFVSNPARDASDVIAGYVYQIDVTISHWLNLQPNELLELERGEDLDALQVSDNHLEDLRILEQVKATAASLTLRSTSALTAIANFCEHRRLNPNHTLKFRYITTSPVGRERGWKSQSAGIDLWESVRAGELAADDEAGAVSEIRDFLRGCAKPDGVKPSTWDFLTDALADQNSAGFRELIQSFEWSTSNGDADSLEAEVKFALVESALVLDAEHAETIFRTLFLYVIKRLAEPGHKQLTPEELREQLRRPPLNAEDQGFVIQIHVLAGKVARLEQAVAEGRSILQSLSEQVQIIAGGPRAEFEYRPPQVSLDVPAIAVPAIHRDRIVNELADQMSATGWASIVGEPGSGKTQLCLLFKDKMGFAPVWISLRGLTEERACGTIDASLEIVSGVARHAIIQRWYSDAIKRLNPRSIVVLDDLPEVIVGSPLYRRLQSLQAACRESGHPMLSTSYFELPQALIESRKASELRAPLFTAEDILDLLSANSAPSKIATDKFAAFLATSTRGLAVLVAAVVRFLASKSWIFETKVIEALFKGEYAAGVKHDAKQIIAATISDSATRELLYRLTCVVGPISRQQVEAIGKVPARINLALEKLSELVGIWVQPYGANAYSLSPLIDMNLANLLDSTTRQGVHATLASLTLRKTLSMADVVACVHHFRAAGLDNQALVVLLRALVKVMDLSTEASNEWMVSSLWSHQPLPETTDMSLRLNLRAVQITLAEKRKKDYRFLSDDLRQLLSHAQSDSKAQLGVFMASSLLATQLFKKQPSLANQYILKALGSARKAVLPNGKKLALPRKMSLEWVLWGTATAAKSDEQVQNWLDTVAQLTPAQRRSLLASDLAEDNSTIICDSVWLREYRKPERERNWEAAQQEIKRISARAAELGLGIVNAAAIRTEITILAECLHRLTEALTLAETALKIRRNDSARFLIEEATGRQLAYAERWEEALRWMGLALQRETKDSSLWRRNLLITVGEGVARYNPSLAPEYARQAVDVAESANMARIRVAEALGEYAITLWNAGEREKAFIAWQKAVPLLLPEPNQPPCDIQVFLAFLHAAAYFGTVAVLGKPPVSDVGNEDYGVPAPGLFLATDRIPVELYEPIKNNQFFIQTAMFAEGVGHTEAAGKWATLALSSSATIGADLLRPFTWLTIAPSLLSDEYIEAVERARSMAVGAVPGEHEFDQIGVRPEARPRIQRIFADQRRFEMSLILGLVPLAFRLSTLRFERDISSDLARLATYLNSIDGRDAAQWKEAATLLTVLLSKNEQSWRQLHSQGGHYYRENRVGLGIVSLLGSSLFASAQQSLVTQIKIAADFEKVFGTMPSIQQKILYPFFEKYWDDVVNHDSACFRTAAAYTRRSFDEARSKPVRSRLKAVFSSMIFCLGLSLPPDLRDWLDR